MDSNDRFIWIDLETGGLDPDECPLMEVGFRITDVDFNLLGEYDWLIWEDWYDGFVFDDFITKMHTKSGLFEEAKQQGIPAPEVEPQIRDWLAEWGVSLSDPMCGSSVQFDRSFLLANLPTVHAMFSYRNIDISTIKELCRRLNPVLYGKIDQNTTKRELHRVKPDLEDTCSEALFYVENFLHVGE